MALVIFSVEATELMRARISFRLGIVRGLGRLRHCERSEAIQPEFFVWVRLDCRAPLRFARNDDFFGLLF